MPWCELARECGWCPLCYSGLRGRRAYKGHAGYRPLPDRKLVVQVSLIPRAPKENAPVRLVAPTGDICAVCVLPALTEFLSLLRWDDGAAREPGTIRLSCSNGMLQVWLNDKDGSRSAWLSGPDIGTLLLAAEHGLGDNELVWKRDNGDWKAKRK